MVRPHSDVTETGQPGADTSTRTGRYDRRQFLRLTQGVGSAAALGAVAGCTGDGDGTATPEPEGTPEPVSLHHVVPEGSFYVVPFLLGIENNSWAQYGIDLNVEVGPFPKFQRQVVADLTPIGGMPMVSAIDFRNQGEDLTWIGPGMTFANYMLSMADSDIETVPDIEGKRLGVPFETSTTTLGFRALVQDAFGMDLLEAPSDVRAAAPPVIWNLLLDGELDVVCEFSGFSIQGQVRDDVRVVFNPIEYWQNEYGTVVPLTQRTTRTSWLEEDPANADLARRWGQGWADSLEVFRNNIEDGIERYGRLGGLTEEGMAEVILDRMERQVQFSTPPYTQDQADANWKFAQSLVDAGVYESLPDRDAMITTSDELDELADG
jgi:ABC-type nitrate/sulfonate/bicarbonate transport system substrate-binding protein